MRGLLLLLVERSTARLALRKKGRAGSQSSAS